MKIKTRFAPSPTGSLHIGGVRTALYEYLVARKNNGQFNLRIEDTDRDRLVAGSAEDIIDTLKWLGLQFDGEVIYQSQRKDIYQEYAQKLIDGNFAYRLDGAIYFKAKQQGTSFTIDLIGSRKIEFDNAGQKDFVILKSDGFPTYHLAHVVDDHLMEINPVIRGAEWISSLPKHLMLFEAFGWDAPSYAHLPVILGPDRSKLSKRHGAKAAGEFKKDGFLPGAILNYLALLGWTPPSGNEILSLEEMISQFDLQDVHLANPVFDIRKLEWMNGEYIRQSQNSNLKSQIYSFLQDLSNGVLDHPTEDQIEKVVPLIKERIKKLSDFIPLTNFLFEQAEYDRQVFDQLKIPDLKSVGSEVLQKLKSLKKPWDEKEFEETFRQLANGLSLSASQIFQLIRVCVSGQLVTPPLFECMQILGEEEAIKRVERVVKDVLF